MYIEDPLVHDRVSARLGFSIFKNMEEAYKKADRIKVPILILVGSEDVITPPKGAKRFYEKLKVEDKELVEFPGAYHEIFDDPEWGEKFERTTIEWLIEHGEQRGNSNAD
ncbi:lysophospholipase [Pyrococcus sp. NA2]|nr:lysophospholipase [Pyrococcus sp. NA2]